MGSPSAPIAPHLRMWLACPLMCILVLFSGCAEESPEGGGHLAEEMGDCDNLPAGALRANCNAIKSGDASLCRSIQPSRIRDECDAVLERDWQKCNQIQDDTIRETCLRYVAIGLEDPSICLNIPDTKEKTYMRDWCLRDVGRYARNVSICQQIRTDYMKNDCLAMAGDGT